MDKYYEDQLEELSRVLSNIRLPLVKKITNKTITDEEMMLLNFVDQTSLRTGRLRDDIRCLKPFSLMIKRGELDS